MADTEVLNVKVRELRGTANARRMREAGETPAVLYGLGKESVSLTVPTDELATVMRHGSHVVQLQGDVKDQALLKEIQWDALGVGVLHLDLTRVTAGQLVEVMLPVELRGEAPGINKGGVVSHQVHEAEVQCTPAMIPEKIEVNINELDVGQSILASEIELPEGVKLLLDPEEVIVSCVEAQAEEEVDDEGLAGGAEPEVIGRKEDDEGESGS